MCLSGIILFSVLVCDTAYDRSHAIEVILASSRRNISFLQEYSFFVIEE
jgi:hypothetical protein